VLAGSLIRFLATWIMTTRHKPEAHGDWPTVAQQQADPIEDLLTF
jgi:hypothetical protein